MMTLLALSVPVNVHALEIGDAQNGLAWAQQVCSECHAIGRGQARSPNSCSPTFSELATTPGMTVGALTVALTTANRRERLLENSARIRNSTGTDHLWNLGQFRPPKRLAFCTEILGSDPGQIAVFWR
jgi:hypothetical protein